MLKKLLLIFFVIFSIPVLVFAQGERKKAVYFYAETCVHCEQVDKYFQEQDIYDRYDIQKIETSGPYNLDYLNRFFDSFRVPTEKRGYPVIFVGDKMIYGSQTIIESFVNEIEQIDATEFPTPEKIIKNSNSNEADAKNIEESQVMSINNANQSIPKALIISAVGAALFDAINPCALAVLILLLATVISAKGRKKALLSGLLFSLAVFLSYFMMGLGVYRAMSVFSLPTYISLGVAILAILVGLANLKDVFWYGKIFIMEVPLSWRPRMQAILKSVANPIGAFGAGFLISLFLVPCASGPYIVILGLLASKVSPAKTIPLLILYNLVFVLPMIGITVAMYFGSRMGKLEAWRQKNLKLLHAITGLGMLFMGIYLMYGWIKLV